MRACGCHDDEMRLYGRRGDEFHAGCFVRCMQRKRIHSPSAFGWVTRRKDLSRSAKAFEFESIAGMDRAETCRLLAGLASNRNVRFMIHQSVTQLGAWARALPRSLFKHCAEMPGLEPKLPVQPAPEQHFVPCSQRGRAETLS